MPKKPVEPSRVIVRGKPRFRVIVPRILNGGKAKRRFFREKADAESFARSVEVDRMAHLEGWHRLSFEDKGLLLNCIKRAGGVEQVSRAVEMFVSQAVNPKTFREVANECIDAKQASGLSKEYVRGLVNVANKFALRHGDLRCHEITPRQIENWLNSQSFILTTKRGFRINLVTLFSYAVRMGYCQSNPAAKVEPPKKDDSEIFILTADECERLMRSVEVNDPGMIPFFAISLFGGLRRKEGRAVDDSEIRDYIEVKAAKSKTASRRLVLVNDTLKAWLAKGGDYQPKNYVRRFQRVRKLTVVPHGDFIGPLRPIRWKKHCMRHSFVSYAIPIYGVKDVAQFAGHSEDVLMKHYRELVPRSSAEKFFQILPK